MSASNGIRATTMCAVTQQHFGDEDVLELAEVPRPTPLPEEVLVRVHAAGVKAVDWKTRVRPRAGWPPSRSRR